MRRSDLVPNPPWVTDVIASSYDTLQATVPHGWLPRLSDARHVPGEMYLSAKVTEYGCGAYGCVIPTLDARVVLKLTTDDTEAEFAAHLAGTLVAPICVKYHMVIKTSAMHQRNRVYLLWRDAANHVGQLRSQLGIAGARYIRRQHKAAQAAYEAARLYPENLARFANKWVSTCERMATQTSVPEIQALGAGMVKVWREQGILFGDIHEGNIGVVDGIWVITDPGNIAVVPSDIRGELHEPLLPQDEVLLHVKPSGRPSQRLMTMVVGNLASPSTPVKMGWDEAFDHLERAIPDGFTPGPYINPHQEFKVVQGVPSGPVGVENTVYIVTPIELAEDGINGGDIYQPAMSSIASRWMNGDKIDPIVVDMTPDGAMYIDDGNEVVQLAARTNRPVAMVVRETPPGWRPMSGAFDIGPRIIGDLPTSIRNMTKGSD